MGCSSHRSITEPLRRTSATAIEKSAEQTERRCARNGDDPDARVRGGCHRNRRDVGLESHRAPHADVEVARCAYRLVGDSAQLRTNLLRQVPALGVQINAAEDI